jgi:hypothetical protein
MQEPANRAKQRVLVGSGWMSLQASSAPERTPAAATRIDVLKLKAGFNQKLVKCHVPQSAELLALRSPIRWKGLPKTAQDNFACDRVQLHVAAGRKKWEVSLYLSLDVATAPP